MNDQFKPKAEDPVEDEYRKDELSNAYADAWEQGFWVKEFGVGPEGTSLCAVGSLYELQKIEFEHPELGSLDYSTFSIMDCMSVSLPGAGDTRAEAVYDGIRAYKESQLWEQHDAWHHEVRGE